MAWTCSVCQITREKPEKRPPSGWKNRNEVVTCDLCWRKAYVLRAVTIPVSSPVECDWATITGALRESWIASTQASNWMMTELYTRDVRRQGEDSKMPAMAKVYLYPETRQRFPSLPSQTCASLEQKIQAKYKAIRYKLIWTCAVSLPTFRYPQPFSLPNQAWSVSLVDERLVVSARIGVERYQMRLKGGHGFRRQRQAVEQIIAGEAVQGEISFEKKGDDTMCKMVAWLPRDPARQAGATGRSGTLRVRTDSEMLLVAANEKDDRLWKYHGDHLLRWSAEHREQLQRWSDDQKAEQRPVPAFAERRAAAAAKYHRRMMTAVKQIAAMLGNYAARRRFAVLSYDDTDTSYCDGFPWFLLRERLAIVLDEHGIAFETQPEKVETPASGVAQ